MTIDIIKFLISEENYLGFKASGPYQEEVNPMELPSTGIFSTASVVKAYYDAHSLTSAPLNGYDPGQKLFVTHE